MKVGKKIKARVITTLLSMVILMAIMTTIAFAEESNFIQSIEIRLPAGETITLTDVHEYYLNFGSQSSLYMAQTGTITFNYTNGPYHPTLGTLYAGTTFALADFINATEPDPLFMLTFILVRDTNSGELRYIDSFEELHQNPYFLDFGTVTINGFLSVEDFEDMMPTHGRSLREREVHQPPQPLYDVTPIISRITMRPPAFHGETNLLITFTDVYDVIQDIGITGMTSYSFFVAPTGSISFDRDVEIGIFDAPRLFVAAGEVINMAEHSSLTLYYGDYVFDSFPYRQRRYFTFITVDDPSTVPLLFDLDWESFCGCIGPSRVSNHAVEIMHVSPPQDTATTIPIDTLSNTDTTMVSSTYTATNAYRNIAIIVAGIFVVVMFIVGVKRFKRH